MNRFITCESVYKCEFKLFQAAVEKIGLKKENWKNFALFEIMEDGFGEYSL